MAKRASAPGTPRREYRLGTRALGMERTRGAILDATLAITDPARITLATVAADARVSTRTVIRHFGSREGLVAAAVAEGERRVAAQRFDAPAGDVDAVVRNLLDHYEEWGDATIARLRREDMDPELDRAIARGRALHRRWVSEKLGSLLDGLPRSDRSRRLAELVAVTDVQTWKLLRRDQGLSRSQTEKAVAEMIRGVQGSHR
jgi:AcrR family transcriptional regulator